ELLDPLGRGVEELVDDATDGTVHLSALRVGEVRGAPVEQTQLVGRDAGGLLPQCGHGRSDDVAGPLREEVADLVSHERAGRLDGWGHGGAREESPQLAQSESPYPGEGSDLEGDVVREGEVDIQLGSAGP